MKHVTGLNIVIKKALRTYWELDPTNHSLDEHITKAILHWLSGNSENLTTDTQITKHHFIDRSNYLRWTTLSR